MTGKIIKLSDHRGNITKADLRDNSETKKMVCDLIDQSPGEITTFVLVVGTKNEIKVDFLVDDRTEAVGSLEYAKHKILDM